MSPILMNKYEYVNEMLNVNAELIDRHDVSYNQPMSRSNEFIAFVAVAHSRQTYSTRAFRMLALHISIVSSCWKIRTENILHPCRI